MGPGIPQLSLLSLKGTMSWLKEEETNSSPEWRPEGRNLLASPHGPLL